MAYLRPYSSPIVSWLKSGTKPPYPWAWRYWDFAHQPDYGPTPPVRPSPGRRAVTAVRVGNNALVNQDYFAVTMAGPWAWPQQIEFEVDGGGFSGSQEVGVSVLSTDTATQVRDKLAAALAAAGPPWQHCYPLDVELGDRYQVGFGITQGAYVMVVDANRAPLDLTTFRNHVTANSTHGSMYSDRPEPLYYGESEVIGLPARWGLSRAVLPAGVAPEEYIWQEPG
jgi:hypothetical protein